MPDSFGARLRERRERQQVALSTIADQTKIKLSLLEGLERDDISRWPPGLFRRAYIRAYASAVGLDADVVLREFLQLYPEPVEEIATESSGGAAGGPPTRLRYVVGAAIGALVRLPQSKAQKTGSAEPEVTTSSASASPIAQPPPVQVPAPVPEPVERDPDLVSAAHLCTSLSRIDDISEAAPLLEQIAGVFDATGLMLWVWDPDREKLMLTLARGYSAQVLAHLPGVGRDAHNATAAAFRSARPCMVDGGDTANGALVVPVMSPHGCVGVLALELPRRREKMLSVRALAVIMAAQLTRLLVVARTVETETDAASDAAPEILTVS